MLHNNSYPDALAHILKQSTLISDEKLATLGARVSGEQGLVGAWVDGDGSRAALIEVNCETDFVARGDVFTKLVESLGNDLLQRKVEKGPLFDACGSTFGSSLIISEWLKARLINQTDETTLAINELVHRGVAKVGEAIQIRQAKLFAPQQHVFYGAYAHGGTGGARTGRMGAVVGLKVENSADLENNDQQRQNQILLFAKKLAQQVAGFHPLSVNEQEGIDSERVLLCMPFIGGGGTVREVLQQRTKEWGCVQVSVYNFSRAALGSSL